MHSAIFLEVTMRRYLFFGLVFVFLLSGCKAVPGDYIPFASETSSDALSNTTCGWGFRRTPQGPEFTAEQHELMNRYKCIYKENTDAKNIYLTFDEGYENGYTGIILDVLREKNVKAAFFVTAPYVKSNPDLIKRMAREGHIIGNHTVNHPSLPDVKDDKKLLEEFFELDRLIYGICGKKCKYLRPPKGEYSERTLSVSHNAGYTNVFWSQAYVDWDNKVSAEKAFAKITSDIHPGCVLLLHAVSKGNAQALGNVIDFARKEGYTFKSLNQYKFKE